MAVAVVAIMDVALVDYTLFAITIVVGEGLSANLVKAINMIKFKGNNMYNLF